MTLFRSDARTGPFTIVPDGSAIMSPMNRVNPDRSEASGHFGWDVIAGFYKVRAEKTGCHAPGDAGPGHSSKPQFRTSPRRSPTSTSDFKSSPPVPGRATAWART